MSAEVWAFLGVVVTSIATVVTGTLQNRKTRRQLSPVSNGFAGSVRGTLARLEQATDRIERKVDDHISAHADASIRGRR